MTGTEKTFPHSAHKTERILAVHRYYWPDTPPYASMLRLIVAHWHQRGHHVDVLSSQPSYKETFKCKKRPKKEFMDGVCIYRLSLPHEAKRPLVRILNAVRLSIAVLLRALVGRYDVIMISTAPPILGAASATLAAKLTGARFIYHCMDIQPEVGTISGEFSSQFVFKFLRKLDSWSCKNANPIVVLSRDMAETLSSRPEGNQFRILIQNNFSIPSLKPIPDKLPFSLPDNSLTILFAGNIGRFQGLDTVVDAMSLIKDRSDILFIMMGEGSVKDSLVKKATSCGANIKFINHQTVETTKLAIQKVDVGFVSLVPNMFRFCYPSKTMTYLEQGCPLIVSVEAESELALDVTSGQYGFCVPAGDSHALAKLLTSMADDPTWKSKMRDNALLKAASDFSETAALKKWSDIVDNNIGT